MVATNELYWAAGFVDGEGCFDDTGKCNPRIKVGQNDPQLLYRLQKIFGGKVYTEKRKYKGLPNDIYLWVVAGRHAASIMMTLYTLLSEKRQAKIKAVLHSWKYKVYKNKPGYISR